MLDEHSPLVRPCELLGEGVVDIQHGCEVEVPELWAQVLLYTGMEAHAAADQGLTLGTHRRIPSPSLSHQPSVSHPSHGTHTQVSHSHSAISHLANQPHSVISPSQLRVPFYEFPCPSCGETRVRHRSQPDSSTRPVT